MYIFIYRVVTFGLWSMTKYHRSVSGSICDIFIVLSSQPNARGSYILFDSIEFCCFDIITSHSNRSVAIEYTGVSRRACGLLL